MSLLNNLPHGQYRVETGRSRQEKIFHSEESDAWIPPGFMGAYGYEAIPTGTLMAKNASVAATGGKGLLVPYVPPTYANIATDPYKHIGRVFLLADVAQAATTLKVPKDRSYRFKVGDDLVIDDDTETTELLGAITDITLGIVDATITFTNAVSGSSGFTVANYANVYVNSAKPPATTVANVGDAATTFDVVNAEAAASFAVGDIVIMAAPGTDIQNLGAITAMSVGATNTTITISTAVSGANMTTANGTIVYALSGAMSIPVGVLTRDRDTGVGDMVSGSYQCPVCVGNAMFYDFALRNTDANAKSVLGMREVNNLILFP